MNSNAPSEEPSTNCTVNRPERRRPVDRTPDRRGSGDEWHRRRFLRAAAGLSVTGVLAGCTSDGSGGTGGGSDGGGTGGSASVEEWLADAGNYDGVVDETGSNAVTVEVGPSGDEMTFAPAAVRVSPGTTVTWRWVGDGYHNVVEVDGGFDSGSPVQGGTFEHTFDAAGVARYYCEPHRSAGMKGAVVVEGDRDGANDTGGE